MRLPSPTPDATCLRGICAKPNDMSFWMQLKLFIDCVIRYHCSLPPKNFVYLVYFNETLLTPSVGRTSNWHVNVCLHFSKSGIYFALSMFLIRFNKHRWILLYPPYLNLSVLIKTWPILDWVIKTFCCIFFFRVVHIYINNSLILNFERSFYCMDIHVDHSTQIFKSITLNRYSNRKICTTYTLLWIWNIQARKSRLLIKENVLTTKCKYLWIGRPI